MNDEFETPQWLFDELNKEFHFQVDLCACQHNKKCAVYEMDFLRSFYNDYVGFMNPPYSNPKPFILQALKKVKEGCTIVMLLKLDPSTKIWQHLWDYKKHKPKPGIEIRFLPKRLKFELNGVPQGTAPFPSVIVIARPI